MIALLCGRPSNLHSSNYNVPIPTISDGDDDRDQSPESMQSFIWLCRLTKILECAWQCHLFFQWLTAF